MNDGYCSSDTFFVAALLFVFGEESLVRITQEEKFSGKKLNYFHLDVPSLDANAYLQDWLRANSQSPT